MVKLGIRAIRNISENYQISLSTDNVKNINFIIDENGTGKTTLL